MKNIRKITPKQYRTIKRVQFYGRRLAKRHPEIESRYKSGEYQKELARDFCNPIYSHTKAAKNIIHYALTELIDRETRIELAKEHFRNDRESRIKGAERSLEAKGLKSYIETEKNTVFGHVDERTYIIHLKLSQDYSWKQITEKTNMIFNNNRTKHSVENQYNKWLNVLFSPIN